MLFDTWTREEVTKWVRHLEGQLVTGAVTISNPDTGSVTFSRGDALKTLKHLKARLAYLDGKRGRPSMGFGLIMPRIHGEF